MANKNTIIIVLFIMFPVARPDSNEQNCPVIDDKDEENELSCFPICPDGWDRHINTCYYVDDTSTTDWEDARAKCQNVEADLPIIKSPTENAFIADLLQKTGRTDAWLGMQRKDKTSKDDFYWIDGSQVAMSTYRNWNNGEPSMGRGAEHCGSMYVIARGHKIAGKWNDRNCDCSSCPVFLCQKPL